MAGMVNGSYWVDDDDRMVFDTEMVDDDVTGAGSIHGESG